MIGIDGATVRVNLPLLERDRGPRYLRQPRGRRMIPERQQRKERSMKARTNHESPRKPTFRPKPLSAAQLVGLELILVGKTDQETADTLGITRETVWSWRREHAVFMAELEKRRADVWGSAGEQLRSLMQKAIDNIAALVESGDFDASIAELKITGMYGGVVNVVNEMDPEKIIKQQAKAQVQREGIPEGAMHESLIRLSQNPRYDARLTEIEAELMAEYGETS
jgi:DNA-binding CsgD family transcriptional regulator